MTYKMGSASPLRAIKIVSIVQIIWGCINIINYLPWVFISLTDEEWADYTAFFFIFLLLGIFYVILGWGFWRLKKWAAQGTRILAIYGIINSFIGVLTGIIPIYLIMYLGIFWVVRRQETKDVFLYGNHPPQEQYDIDDGVIDI